MRIAELHSKAAFQAAAHGTFQGTMSGIQGGNFWTGFAAGALSSIAASAWSGGTTETTGFSQENNWAYGTKTITHTGLGAGTGTAGMIAFGTVMGGAGAALTGGNFWQGAVTGLMVSGLNHAIHIDTKNKTAVVEDDGKDYDTIFVNGKETMATRSGALRQELQDNGYSISMKDPQGVGMALTDFALEIFGAKGLGLLGSATISKHYGAKLFESKLMGYASKYYGRYNSKYLPNGVKGIWNNGFLRTGWGNNAGVNTFRTSIGHNPNQIHLDWFWKP